MNLNRANPAYLRWTMLLALLSMPHLATAEANQGGVEPVQAIRPLSHYVSDDPAQQRATARAILKRLNADRLYVRPSASVATATLLFEMFAGGAGGAVDVVTVSPDLLKKPE